MRHSGRHTAAISRGRPLLLHSDRRGHRRSAPPGAQRSQVLRVESVGVLYLARESGCRALQCGGVRALRIAVVDAVVVAIESILAFLATTRDSSDAVTPASCLLLLSHRRVLWWWALGRSSGRSSGGEGGGGGRGECRS